MNKELQSQKKQSQEKTQKLILGIIFDLIGMISYLIPLYAESIDLIWAPISGILLMKMYKGATGKVAGVNIRQSNTMGGSANVLIRGTTSLTGNNQALFVVDGVPIDNSNTNTSDQTSGYRFYSYFYTYLVI